MPGGWHPTWPPPVAEDPQVALEPSRSATGWSGVTQWVLPLLLAHSPQRHWDGCGVPRPL